jgi:hypothetical protein
MLAEIEQVNTVNKSACELILAWLYHVSPALIAVTAGAFGVNRFFIRRANAAALGDRICADLKNLSEDLLAYWSYYSDEPKAYFKSQVLAQKIKGALQATGRDLRCFAEQYHPAIKSEIERLMIELTDAATGGSFETKSPVFNPEKYLVIVNRVGAIRSILLKSKL